MEGKGAKQGAPEKRRSQGSTPCTVLFVEQTPRGELAHRFRELLQRLVPTLGFNIKTVERTRATLRGNFPLYMSYGRTSSVGEMIVSLANREQTLSSRAQKPL